jgi:hypothetical protein
MISLRIKVPTKYRWLPSYRIRKNIPERWQEVSKKQLLAFCRVQQLAKNDAQQRILAARYMLRLPWWLFYIVNRYQLAEITRELHWLNQEPLTINLLPRLGRLLGPADNFGNVRFAEFAVASVYYQAYINSQKPELLDFLLAVLYRPIDGHADKNALDRRVSFEQHHLSGRVRHVRRLSLHKKQAVLMYFGGCMSDLAMRYPQLFSGAEQEYAPGQSTGSSDWLDFMRHLPADKFGDLDKIENSLVHPIMEVANRMMIDAKKEKARLKRRPQNH